MKVKPPNKVIHFVDGVTVLALQKRNGDVLPAFVDTADYALVKSFKRWSHAQHKHTSYAVSHCSRSQKPVYLHAVLAGAGADHKDHNGLNNLRSNLRSANQSQNAANRRLSCKNTSGFKGVYFFAKKWKARIEVNGKEHHLGTFETAIDAAFAYDSAARKYFKDFAVLNFPALNLEEIHV